MIWLPDGIYGTVSWQSAMTALQLRSTILRLTSSGVSITARNLPKPLALMRRPTSGCSSRRRAAYASYDAGSEKIE